MIALNLVISAKSAKFYMIWRLCVPKKQNSPRIAKPRRTKELPSFVAVKLMARSVKRFWHIFVTEHTQAILRFSFLRRRYSYERLPFGMSLVFEIFQNLMNKLFSNLGNVGTAQDDIFIHAKTLKELRATTKQVFQIIKNNALKFSEDSYIFENNDIKFLGYIISTKNCT